MIKLSLLLTLMLSTLSSDCSQIGTVIENYLLLKHPDNQNKLLILSAIPGPRTIAHLHQVAFRTFLSILMTGAQTVELVTEDTVPFNEDTVIKDEVTYKNYLNQRPTRTIKYVSYDFRDKVDADILTVFTLIAKELDMLFETNIISSSRAEWPSHEFFNSNSAYQMIKNQIIKNSPKITVSEYISHIQEQKDMFNDREQFALIKTEILDDIKSKFELSSSKIFSWLSQISTTRQNETLINIILSAIETGNSLKYVEEIAELFIDPGTIIAHAGFLQGILTSQQKNHVIFFANARQTTPVTAYLQRMGYQPYISTPLISKEKNGIKIMDGWALINLFQQTFASEENIKQQKNLLDLFLSHRKIKEVHLPNDLTHFVHFFEEKQNQK